MSFTAWIAASLTKSGVSKSGSPRLSPIISFPSSLNSLALAAIAKVAEVDRLLILSESWFMRSWLCVVYACIAGFIPISFKNLKCAAIAFLVVLYSLYGKLNSLAVSLTILAIFP